MNRRDFMGLTLAGLVGLALGCSRKTDTEAGGGADLPRDAAPSGAGTPAGATETGNAAAQKAKCPKCGADNDIVLDAEGKPKEMTCWKCGHKWTPSL